VKILCRIAMMMCLWNSVGTGIAHADDQAEVSAITARLQAWTAAFNARDAKAVCDLFASDLIATTPDALDGNRDALCGRLSALLAKTDVQFSYRPDILEIIVSGDLAVVRVNWTLTIKRNGTETSGVEAGLDVFKRQPDNRWSISRFLAFTTKDRTSELGTRP
jgi:uncharacterized protein (TIGR02246 family)